MPEGDGAAGMFGKARADAAGDDIFQRVWNAVGAGAGDAVETGPRRRRRGVEIDAGKRLPIDKDLTAEARGGIATFGVARIARIDEFAVEFQRPQRKGGGQRALLPARA